jgi:hypothetical protein
VSLSLPFWNFVLRYNISPIMSIRVSCVKYYGTGGFQTRVGFRIKPARTRVAECRCAGNRYGLSRHRYQNILCRGFPAFSKQAIGLAGIQALEQTWTMQAAVIGAG